VRVSKKMHLNLNLNLQKIQKNAFEAFQEDKSLKKIHIKKFHSNKRFGRCPEFRFNFRFKFRFNFRFNSMSDFFELIFDLIQCRTVASNFRQFLNLFLRFVQKQIRRALGDPKGNIFVAARDLRSSGN